MIDVFPVQDREVSRKLMERATSLGGLVLICGVKQSKNAPAVETREPFASLDKSFGHLVHQLIVVEEESNKMAWRDPLGDITGHYFPEDKTQAYAAAAGYLLVRDGEPEAVIKKQGTWEKDAWNIQEALAAAHREIPRPGQTSKAASGKRLARPAPPVGANEPTPIPGQKRVKEAPPTIKIELFNPWAVLGVQPGTPMNEVRRAFRALMAQYHPDKVAHLAEEFRVLAEEKSREITRAWEALQSPSEGGPESK